MMPWKDGVLHHYGSDDVEEADFEIHPSCFLTLADVTVIDRCAVAVGVRIPHAHAAVVGHHVQVWEVVVVA